MLQSEIGPRILHLQWQKRTMEALQSRPITLNNEVNENLSSVDE